MDTERLVEPDPARGSDGTKSGSEGSDRPSEHSALGLFHLDNISEALKNASWSVRQEVKLLADLARSDTVNARIRMEAAARIREIVKEAAILSGYIRRLAISQEKLMDSDGRILTSTRITGDRFLKTAKDADGSDTTLAKLEAGLALHEKQPQLNADLRARRLYPTHGSEDPAVPAEVESADRPDRPDWPLSTKQPERPARRYQPRPTAGQPPAPPGRPKESGRPEKLPDKEPD